jgi:regulator of cell morphogenesis and NO signaling
MLKEERVLFPAILELGRGPSLFPFGSIANPIGMMGVEHERVGVLLARLRAVTGDYAVPDDGCASYRALYEQLSELEHDTHLHVFEENHLLFPEAVALEASRS